MLVVIVAVTLATAFFFAFGKYEGATAGTQRADAEQHDPQNTLTQPQPKKPHVEAVHPRPGGLRRSTTQPAIINSFGIANLYAQVSGYLKTQQVDIGDRIKMGEVLAVIDVPEIETQLKGNQAQVGLAQSKVEQAEARVNSAVANWRAAKAAEQQSEEDVNKAVATRVFREKAYSRIKELFELKSIEEKLVDEEQERRDSARASERAANAALVSARAQIDAALASVELAKADVHAAKQQVRVAEAAVERTQVSLDYAKIVAPFDGVITVRNYYPGDFVPDAQQGASKPILAAVRTDLMRVVVQIPDDDVAYVRQGEEASISVDALGGREFTGQVSRMANKEDELTRTMRIEIDLPNPDNLLRDGMYGRATIKLAAPSANAVTIPSGYLVGNVEHHHGSIYVVDNGKMRRQEVTIGADDGTHVEVLEGVDAGDWVVTNRAGIAGNNVPVEVIERK
ncbi:MAG: efflux RND transporter periplasmic adaptor subunit [Planctomycetes bacterium]|nr:efflux RND transporter periplasmic adaptor subunit [Planctomycetota bacterium]